MTVFVGENDTAPVINGVLGVLNGKNTFDNASATAVTIAGATVRFHMLDSSGTVKVDSAATNTEDGGGDTGEVTYSWVAADTDTSGWFKGEFEVTFADGTVQTYPNQSKIPILISGDIA